MRIRNKKVDSLSKAFICEKALDIYGDLVRKTLGANSGTLTSKQAKDGSKSGIHSILRHGDTASSNKKGREV